MITENDKQDILLELNAQLEDCANGMLALAKEKQSNPTAVVYVDNDGNDVILTVYDFKYHTWKSTDTFDKLANDFMGNADYGTAIAYFNTVANESELEAGVKIKIPILEENSINQNNRIYAAPERQENYGIDLNIDDNGDLAIAGGDIKTISDRDNLTQSIAMRLTTATQKRIRLSSYGIRSTIGEPLAVESYLISSIEQTIKADPRIETVEEITFSGEGDKLFLEVVYVDINGNKGSFKGDI